MTRRIVLRPVAEADINAAAACYEERSPLTAARFWRAVEEKLQLLRENPFQYQRVIGPARRALLRDFPQALFYIATDDEIVIVACTHGRRHPKRWQDRVPE
jgi:plasmid stabilization system protein ParE